MFWQRYEKRKEVKNGIKAQSKRGAFGTTWWARRWIATLESFDIGERLNRGKSYARSGQVISIDIDKGFIASSVQGSRPKPYKITIKLATISEDECKNLANMVAQKPLFAAQLLNGQMPQELETIFKESGLSLFPSSYRDLVTECSCPDSSNPCKHIAAVYLLLAEEFDRDPFLMLTLRGITKEGITALVDNKSKNVKQVTQAKKSKVKASDYEPLSTNPLEFWQGKNVSNSSMIKHNNVVNSLLHRRLGNLPFWRSAIKFMDVMDELYTKASDNVQNQIENLESF